MDNFRTEITPEPGQPEPDNTNWRRTIIDILETIFLSVVLFVGINLVSSRIRVESISMQPTLYAGNFVLVNKLAFNFVEPERGDVIVFKYPPDPTQVPYIKRIIGLPGDTIHIEGGKVFINGQELIEPYLVEPTNRGGDWVVPENNLFVMGDNRNSSSDSRTWGTVPMENIIGRAEIVYWPPEKWGLLHMNTAIAGSAP